jgi:hypothetical protein
MTPDELQLQIVQLQNQITELRGLISSGQYSNTVLQNKNVIQASGAMQSPDFVTGSTGWSINSDGSVEFSDGVFRGDITATTGTIGSTTISSTALTGGIIQTDTTGDRMVMTDDSYASNNNPAIDCYDGTLPVGALRPQIGTAGKGLAMEAYVWGTSDVAASVGVIYGDDIGALGGEYHEVEFRIDGGNAASFLKDENFSNIDYIDFNCRISSSLNPPIGTGTANGDLGTSTATWDNAWIEDVNYQTLSDFSDKRLKKNIVDLDVGLNELLQLRPVNFEWKKGGKKDSGFIAQEVKNVIPSMVKRGKQKNISYGAKEITLKDGTKKTVKDRKNKTVTYSDILPDEGGDGLLMMEPMRLIPILVKAIQELNAKVDALTNPTL